LRLALVPFKPPRLPHVTIAHRTTDFVAACFRVFADLRLQV